MVRKNYPFNERDEKKMINFISQILVYSVLAPLLLFGIKSFGNEDSDILENSILGVILLISSFISNSSSIIKYIIFFSRVTCSLYHIIYFDSCYRWDNYIYKKKK